MALFEQGNKNYLFRLTDGKFKAYTVNEWALKLSEYFDFMANDFWNKKESIKSGDLAGTTMDVPQQTPLSRKSLCIFAEISEQTLRNYASNEGTYVDYFDLTTHALNIIDNNQIEGALLGVYNTNLVARLQGIKDQTENINKNENTNVNYDHLTAEEIKDILGK